MKDKVVGNSKPMLSHYRCYKCHKKWMNSNAWSGLTQMCTRCGSHVLPTNFGSLHTQPAYELTYRCNNNECKKTHTLRDITLETHNKLISIFSTNCTFGCSGRNENLCSSRRPTRVIIHHQKISCHVCCYAPCNHCVMQHKAQSMFLDKKVFECMTRSCDDCNELCIIREIRRL
jgi:hypothetical protein